MKLKISLSTNKVGSYCSTIVEVPDEALEYLTQNQRVEYFDELAQQELCKFSLGELCWEEVA